MFQNMNPILRAVLMFVLGTIALLAVYYIVPAIKHTEVELNWFKIVGGGVLIAVLDFIFPSDVRKKNRENIFKK